MNRKFPILDPRSSVTLDAIDFKFGTRDYVVGATQNAKNYDNRPSRGPPAKEWNIMFNVFLFILFFLSYILRSSGEHIFESIATVFASNDVLRWGSISYPSGLNFKIKNFPLLQPQNMSF